MDQAAARGGGANQGVKIAKDSIARVTSGIVTEDNSMVLSHLHPTMNAS